MFKPAQLKSFCLAVLMGGASVLSMPAMATNEAMLDLLKALYENGQITAEQYELISNAARADAEKTEGIKAETRAEVDKATKVVDEKIAGLPKITTEGKFKVESADGSWSWQPIGRIFWDTVWVDQDGYSGEEESGTELRRARMGFEARFMKYFKGKVELDFAEGENPEWKDVWISYNDKNSLGSWSLKLGQQHVSFGHATISSSKYMPLMRRPLFADGPQLARNVGVSFLEESADENRWFLHTGAYFNQLPGSDDEVNTDSGSPQLDSVIWAIRAGGTPIYQDKNHLVHVGGSYQWENLNGETFNRIDNCLVTHLCQTGDTIEADFGSNAEELNAFGAEIIGVWGPFHAVGEFVYWSVDDPDSDADLYAWAIDAGWFLTGESMKYDYGAFGGIGPKSPFGHGGYGAWQIAGRVENMDLNDGNDIDGGDAYVFTGGVNWYPVKNVRFMLNYTHVLDFECADTTTVTFDGCNTAVSAAGAEQSGVQFRTQVYW